MRASEILGRNVVDVDGTDVGHVHDLRVVRETGASTADAMSLRLEGLVLGRGAIAGRLGYDRGEVDGPWLLRVIARRLHARARYVEWAHVVERGDVLRLDVRIDELGPPPALPAPDGEARR